MAIHSVPRAAEDRKSMIVQTNGSEEHVAPDSPVVESRNGGGAIAPGIPDPGLFYKSTGKANEIESSGERYIPVSHGPQIAYEHWHRYLYASQFVLGKTVLDIASGEGYGSHYLAQTAEHVVGVDAALDAVQHASSQYLRPNLEFHCGSAHAIPLQGNHLFDVVVSFETIEHIGPEQQLLFLSEIKRLLKPDGVLLISTPNKLLYSDKPGYKNSFHLKEYYYHEYVTFLNRSFRTVHVLGQKVYPVSYLWQLTGSSQQVSEYQIARSDGSFGPVAEDKKEVYLFVAVCSNGVIDVPGGSVLLDISEQATRLPQEQIAEKDRAIQALSADLTVKEQAIQALSRGGNETLQREAETLRARLHEIIREKELSTVQFEHRIRELTHEADLHRHFQEIIRTKDDSLNELQYRLHDLTNQAELRQRIHELTREKEAANREVLGLRQTVAEQKEQVSAVTARIELLTQEKEAANREVLELRQTVAEQKEQLSAVTTRIELLTGREKELGDQLQHREEEMKASQTRAAQERAVAQRELTAMRQQVSKLADREKELRELLLDAHDQLRHRDEELQLTLAKILQRSATVVNGAVALAKDPATDNYLSYHLLIHQIREVVCNQVPIGSTLLVVSRGDDALVELEGRKGWHFPQQEDGVYAGYNPADSAAAVSHLETLRTKGAGYILFPATALWWFEHYSGFQQHLETYYRLLFHQDDIGVLYSLREQAPEKEDQYRHFLGQIQEVVSTHLPPDATVIVLSKGDERLLQLEGRPTLHFPQKVDGTYDANFAGNCAAAAAHLEALRNKGANFILFPTRGPWWVEHYQEFRNDVGKRYGVAASASDVCVIFALYKGYIENLCRRESEPQPSTRIEKPFGVNLAGYISSEKAVGEGARADIRCIKAAKIPHVLNNVLDAGSENNETTYTQFAADNPYSINLIHVNAREFPDFLKKKNAQYFEGHYNIGYWAWELSHFPKEWSPVFSYFDEIWVPSNFVLDSVARAAPIPVVRMPHSLREEQVNTTKSRSFFGLPEGKFIFFFMFDFHSFMERKHPLGLTQAFKKAFGRRDDVLLVLKGSHSTPDQLQMIREAAAGANVQVLDKVMSRDDVTALMNLSDCYVSLHRSEGFGLTMAEAMSMAKPVIATSYSGNTDFMTPANSFLVKYSMTEIEEDHGPYRKGWVWADPDLDHAAELMRYVYDNQELAKKVGRRAQQDVLRDLHPRVIGQLYKERFLQIAALGKIASPKDTLVDRPAACQPEPATAEKAPVSNERQRYQKLVERIRAVVSRSLPTDATVIVISKGDDDLLRLDGCRGWHFPQQANGVYAGYNPADSAEIITHLEALRTKGADYLLLPSTAFWWLDHYGEFRQHLETHYPAVARQYDTCFIFDLRQPATKSKGGLFRRLLRLFFKAGDKPR